MIDPVQTVINFLVLIAAVGALLFVFYSRTNAVEKTGYGALIMLTIVSLLIPIFWIVESNNEAMATAQQHTTSVQRGVALYAQYCYQCHGTKGQGRIGPKLNNNSAVNNFTDNDLMRVISGGIYDTADPTKPLMPAWSDRYGGPLTDNDIQYLFDLIRSSDPAYLQKNGLSGGNGFTQVATAIQALNPTAYQTAVAQEGSGQFGKPVDMTKQKAITINIVAPPPGASCSPACFEIPNLKVKVGTVITWVNKSTTPHTASAIQGTDVSNIKVAKNIFDSGLSTPITPGGKFTYTVTAAAFSFNPSTHTVVYYCQFHPSMLAELTIVQ
jgi:plastocyanin/mono/diheme cytochrome c family protein